MYDWIKHILQPFTLALIVLGVLLLWRRRAGAAGRAPKAVLACYVALVLASWGPVCHLLLGGLEGQYADVEVAPAGAPAIVVLGGGRESLARCETALGLYRPEVHRLILLSGTGEAASGSDAARMRGWLLARNVPLATVAVEESSRSTHENAARCAELLRERGIGRVVLVTDAAHLPRAVACFRKQGLEVVPAPGNRRLGPALHWPSFVLPNADAAQNIQYAAREWLGLFWYWALDRI